MLYMKFAYDRPAGLRDINVWKCERAHIRTRPARVPSYKLTECLRLRWAKKNNRPEVVKVMVRFIKVTTRLSIKISHSQFFEHTQKTSRKWLQTGFNYFQEVDWSLFSRRWASDRQLTPDESLIGGSLATGAKRLQLVPIDHYRFSVPA